MSVNVNPQNVFGDFELARQNYEHTSTKKIKNKTKAVAAASLAGAVIPLALYNIKRGKINDIKDMFSKDSSMLKKAGALTGLFEVDGIKGILTSISGSILAGLAVGNAGEKNISNKKARRKEALYAFMNCMIPMSIISAVEYGLEKKNIKTGIFGKAAMVIGGVLGGTFVANKVANGINKIIFKEEEKEKFEKRKIKPTDYLVHMDDVLAVMVMAKVPGAQHLGKALPFIFTHVGEEVGNKPYDKKDK